MAVLGIKGGSRLRHVNGERLNDLEDMIASLPYKVEIINVHKVGSQWYVHFYIDDTVKDPVKVVKETAMETKTKKVTKKARRK